MGWVMVRRSKYNSNRKIEHISSEADFEIEEIAKLLWPFNRKEQSAIFELAIELNKEKVKNRRRR